MQLLYKVKGLYEPEDFNFHLYLSKKEKLLDPTTRTNILRGLINEFTTSYAQLTCVGRLTQASIDNNMLVQIDMTASNIVQLRNAFEVHRKCVCEALVASPGDEAVRYELIKLDRLLNELKVCFDIARAVEPHKLVSQISTEERALLKVEYNRLLEAEFLTALGKIKERALAKQCTRLVDFIDEFELAQDYSLPALQTFGKKLGYFAEHKSDDGDCIHYLRDVIAKHCSNSERLHGKNGLDYLSEVIALASCNRNDVVRVLDNYWIDRKNARDGHEWWDFFGWGYTKQQKHDAKDALDAVLAGESRDLRPHLPVLRNGRMGRELRAKIKAGELTHLVGRQCYTVRDFVAALAEKDEHKFSRNLMSVVSKPRR